MNPDYEQQRTIWAIVVLAWSALVVAIGYSL